MSRHKERKVRESRGEIRSRLKNFLMFLPNLVVLLGRLLKDARVPAAEKALFAAAIVYVISPLDFIPDVFPFIGQVDEPVYRCSYDSAAFESDRCRGSAFALAWRRRHCFTG